MKSELIFRNKIIRKNNKIKIFKIKIFKIKIFKKKI